MKLLPLTFALTFTQLSWSQTDTALYNQCLITIDSYAESVNQKINLCADEDEIPCGTYSNTLVINDQGNGWRAVGNYQKKITFWYTDQPEFAKEETGKAASALIKVEVDIQSTYSKRDQYYYKDGELIFCYSLFSDDYVTNEESWAYFEGNKYLQNGLYSFVPIAENKVGKRTHENGSSYMKLFLEMFQPTE